MIVGSPVGVSTSGDHPERRRLLRAEVVAQLVVHLAARRRLAAARGRRARPNLMPRNGAPRNSSSDDDRGGDRQRPPHDDDGDAVPEALADRPSSAPARTAPDCARPSVAEQRGQHHDRADGRDGDDGDAGVGERPQEVQREDQQRGQRDGDGQRALNSDGAARGLHRRARRRPRRVVAAAQLLAEAGHDEQAVVDGQAEAHGGGEVEREDRHVGDEREHPQHEERADDGEHADGQRERCGDDAAEHEDEQQQRDRERDHLGPSPGPSRSSWPPLRTAAPCRRPRR